MTGPLMQRLRKPALFALTIQGLSGLIQVSAFVSLTGADYLSFSEAFLTGTALSLLLVLNFENEILGGAFSVAMRRYFLFFWVVGIADLLHAGLTHAAAPSFAAFAAWGVCSRMFLAWSSNRLPALAGTTVAGLAGLAALLSGAGLAIVMLVAMAAFPLAALRTEGPPAAPDSAVHTAVVASARAFLAYLPHTLSGMLVTYVDRFVALKIVGGAPAESYLRAVQVCSWAAFLIYPVVFQTRSRLLQQRRLEPAAAMRGGAAIAASLVLGLATVLGALHLAGKAPDAGAMAFALVLAALVCSQSYQVVSSLNFVERRFQTINRITLISAVTVLALGFGLVPVLRTTESLAFVLLAGWLVQLALTLASLRRQESP